MSFEGLSPITAPITAPIIAQSINTQTPGGTSGSKPLRNPSSSALSSPSITRPPLSFARIPLLKSISAFLILLLVTVIRFFPSSNDPTQQYLGGIEGDNGLYVWLFRYHVHQLFTPEWLLAGGWFDTNGFYPYQGTLAWSDNFILPGFFGYLLVSAGVTEAAAYNIVILSAYTLSGFFFWLCVARLTGSMAAGLISAVGWLSWSYWGLHIGHPQMMFHMFLPAGLYLFLAAIRRPSLAKGACATILVTAAFATTAYYAIFLALIWTALFTGLLIAKPNLFLSFAHLRTVLGAVLTAPILIPILLPYFDTLALFGERGLYEAHYFSPTIWAWAAAPSQSLLYGWTGVWGVGEAYLFPGCAVMILAALSLLRLARTPLLRRRLILLGVALLLIAGFSAASLHAAYPYPWRIAVAISAWLLMLAVVVFGFVLRNLETKRGFTVLTHRSLVFAFVFLTAAFFVLSFGPLGNPEKGQLALGPWTALHHLVPGASAIRAVSRSAIVVMLGLCMLAGLGLGLKLPSNPKLLIVAPFLILIIWVEGAMRIQHAQALPSLPRAVTELQRISRASELVSNRPLVAIGLPYAGALNDRAAPESWTDFASRQTRLLNWLTPWRGAGSIRTINGYSGQQTKLMRELPRALQSFPDERSIQTLCRFPELRFIVAFAGTALPSNLPSALRLVYAENDQPTLLELRCDAVPFKLRELVMPAAAASITCATDTPDLLSVTGSTPQKWDLQRSAGEISIRKAASDATKSRHLTWVTITAEQSATLRDCRLTFE